MTGYSTPSLSEGTDDTLTPHNDAFPFRSDEGIDDLFTYSGDKGSGASALKEDAADRGVPDRKGDNNQHGGTDTSPKGGDSQSRNCDASHQNGEAPYECGNGQDQGDTTGPGNGAALKKSDDVNSSNVLFDDLGLPEGFLFTVEELGFSVPTAIQVAAIPILLGGRDVVGVAQTGTGKTAAFAFPLLAYIDPERREIQALVLAPTRELAMQRVQTIKSFAIESRGIDVAVMYGGSSYLPQLRAFEGGAQVAVGASGRIMGLMDRNALHLDTVCCLALSEADEMPRMGFTEDVGKIASEVPKGRVSTSFSATMPPSVRRTAECHLSDTEEVAIPRPMATASAVRQIYVIVPGRCKIDALARVLAIVEVQAVLVFIRTRSTAEDLTIELGAHGVATATLSDGIAQRGREKLVAHLYDGTLGVLMTTNIIARGPNIDRIGLAVNFDVPYEADIYVRRIGRTRRVGRTNESITSVVPRRRPRLHRTRKQTGSRMEQTELPTLIEILKLRARRTVEQAMARVAERRLWVYGEILENFVAGRARAAIQSGSSAHLDSHERGSDSHPQHDSHPLSDPDSRPDLKDQAGPMSLEALTMTLLALVVRSPDPVASGESERLTEDFGSKRGGRPRKEHQPRHQMKNSVRYRMEVGHKDRIGPGAIVGALTYEDGLSGPDLGHTDISPTPSFVGIEVSLSPEVRKHVSQARISGGTLRISEDHDPGDFHDNTGRGRPCRDSDCSDRGHSRGDRGPRCDRTTHSERDFKHDRRGRADHGSR